MHAAPGSRPRYGEHSKLVPVTMVASVITALYIMYVLLHGTRLLQIDLPYSVVDWEMWWRGVLELTAFHCVSGLLMYCLVRCILTHPGGIPDSLGWEIQADVQDASIVLPARELHEKKGTGERRHCKWCLKYKPDRCHHCRVCNMCVLRMDHHCPWVYNCIGFRNHKYFFLLLVYAAIDLALISVTMFDTVWWSTRIDVPWALMLALVVGEAFVAFLTVVTVTFLAFHVWLIVKALTTVEFCEKSLKNSGFGASSYSAGTYGNICAALGPNPWLWFLPTSFPEGDGMTWPVAGSRSTDARLQRAGPEHSSTPRADEAADEAQITPSTPLVAEDAQAAEAEALARESGRDHGIDDADPSPPSPPS